MRDHLLGYPPALLALDPEPRVSRETPPRPPACADARSGAVIDRAETAALVPADCKQIKATTHVYGGMVDDVTPEAAPPSAPAQPAGVWVKTADRQPTVGTVTLTRCNSPNLSPNERELRWDGKTWRAKDNANIGNWSRDWLDTSPQPDADGWIAHTPGPCPVAAGTRIDFKHTRHDGLTAVLRGAPAGDGPGWEGGAITHYRVVK